VGRYVGATVDTLTRSAPLERLTDLDDRARSGVLGLARIGVGLMWLANLHWKVPSDFGQESGGGLFKYSESVTRNSPFGLFTWVNEELILPNFRFWGWFTLVAEMIVAALLLIGYRTKLAAIAGAFLTVPIMLSVLYYDRADEWSWSYLLMLFAHLLIWGSNAGDHLGVDGLLRRAGGHQRALVGLGVLTTVIGVAGLYVARIVPFATSKVALLGSDAGFIDEDGRLVRRWELKFIWFNPLWAILTIACGVLLIASIRQLRSARFAGYGLLAMAAIIFAMRTFDYLRDDETLQRVATASNAAVWGGLGLAVLLLERRSRGAETGPITS
jgi:thiosulfate dehydrogenase (quinone) large subunit